MGIGPVVLILVEAALLGAAAQLVQGFRGPRTSFDGVIVGVVAFGLGLLVGTIRPIGPQWDGLYVGPAIIAAAFWAVVVAGLLRYVARPHQSEA
jgi:hypothetical protein